MAARRRGGGDARGSCGSSRRGGSNGSRLRAERGCKLVPGRHIHSGGCRLYDLQAAAREWSEADESYQGFVVLETRVIGQGKGKGDAFVRVAYTCATTPPEGQRYTVVVKAPGEWWTVEKVHGLWKVNWLPRG